MLKGTRPRAAKLQVLVKSEIFKCFKDFFTNLFLIPRGIDDWHVIGSADRDCGYVCAGTRSGIVIRLESG